MILEALPDIPRGYTALAEWSACLVYILLIRRRFGSLPRYAIMAGGLVGFWAVQSLAATFPKSLWTLGMFLAVSFMYGFILLCSDVSARDAGYFVARAFVLAELVASLQWQLHSFFFPPGTTGSTWTKLLLLVTLYGLAFVLAFFVERRHFPAGPALDVDTRDLLSTVAIALVTFFVSNLSFINANTPFSGRLGLEIFYIRTLVDLAGYVALYAQQGQRLEIQRTVEVEAMNRVLHTQHEQYLQSKRNIDVVNRKYHDLKHFITAIRAETNPETKAGYLDQLEDSIKGYEAQVETGNTVLDTILTAKSSLCADNGITITCVADGTALDFMEVMDLSAFFGNALDNAIESTIALDDPEHRLIRVAVYRQRSFVMLKVENYYTGKLDLSEGLPRTTKGHTSYRGYGLKNMQHVAERYNGTLTVHAEDHWFVVRALIPIPPHRTGPAS